MKKKKVVNTCLECKKGLMKEVLKAQVLSLPGAPTFSVMNVPVLVCEICTHEVMEFNESGKLEKQFCLQVIRYYMTRPIPGKVAQWIWKFKEMDVEKVAQLSGTCPKKLQNKVDNNLPVEYKIAKVLLT